jgi:hypothetical protein
MGFLLLHEAVADALSEIEYIDFPGVGRLEAFFTDSFCPGAEII